MYDLTKADKIYQEMQENGTDIFHEMVLIFRDTMPKEYCKLMYILKFGCHIVTAELYNNAVKLLEWANEKGSGAKWSVEDLEKLSKIDFDEKKYYNYDFAYVANMLYSDYCHIFTEPEYYIGMAKAYLEDADYMGKPDERAYKDAMKRIEYYKEK